MLVPKQLTMFQSNSLGDRKNFQITKTPATGILLRGVFSWEIFQGPEKILFKLAEILNYTS